MQSPVQSFVEAFLVHQQVSNSVFLGIQLQVGATQDSREGPAAEHGDAVVFLVGHMRLGAQDPSYHIYNDRIVGPRHPCCDSAVFLRADEALEGIMGWCPNLRIYAVLFTAEMLLRLFATGVRTGSQILELQW